MLGSSKNQDWKGALNISTRDRVSTPDGQDLLGHKS